MGMFDYVRCEIPLPDGFEGDLQTKDVEDPFMLTHVITKEGRFMRSFVTSAETVPKAERPYPDAEEGDLRSMLGSLRINTELRDVAFHGTISFGGLEILRYEPDERFSEEGRPIYKHHDYTAKFTDGQLVEISISPGWDASVALATMPA